MVQESSPPKQVPNISICMEEHFDLFFIILEIKILRKIYNKISMVYLEH